MPVVVPVPGVVRYAPAPPIIIVTPIVVVVHHMPAPPMVIVTPIVVVVHHMPAPPIVIGAITPAAVPSVGTTRIEDTVLPNP